ncbi:hypothetical protein ACNKHS_00025 [Shigella flexneri]
MADQYADFLREGFHVVTPTKGQHLVDQLLCAGCLGSR